MGREGRRDFIRKYQILPSPSPPPLRWKRPLLPPFRGGKEEFDILYKMGGREGEGGILYSSPPRWKRPILPPPFRGGRKNLIFFIKYGGGGKGGREGRRKGGREGRRKGEGGIYESKFFLPLPSPPFPSFPPFGGGRKNLIFI